MSFNMLVGFSLIFSSLLGLKFNIFLKIKVAGKIDYKMWRKFETERRMENCKNFIDGDLIESYLELSTTDAAIVAKDFKVFLILKYE